MSNFIEKASEVFPSVPWSGYSTIHVSHAMDQFVAVNPGNIGMVLKLLKKAEVPRKVWELHVVKLFPQMEWLIEQDTFMNLMLIDLGRTLGNQPTVRTPDSLINPETGNVFHRIALHGGYVGGFRCWAIPVGVGFNLGWRFRIVKVEGDAEEVDIRERARDQEVTVQATIHEIDELMDMAEPPTTANVVAAMMILQEH